MILIMNVSKIRNKRMNKRMRNELKNQVAQSASSKKDSQPCFLFPYTGT